jgi:hypothetical protein
VLTAFYGTDSITFSTTGDATPGVVRTFNSFAACADEVGMSRVYGGFHFMFDNIAGKESGRKIGDFISANYLLANDALPLVRLESAASGQSAVRVHGHIGRTCVLEASPDLKNWTAISTNLAIVGGVLVQDNDTSACRFFRVLEN